MKKFSLWMMLVAALVFTGCSDDDDDKKISVVELPSYTAQTTDYGDTENPVKSWLEGEGESWEYTSYQTLLTDQSKVFEFDCISNKYGIAGGFAFTNLTSGDKSAVAKDNIKNSTYILSFYSVFSKYDVAVNFKNTEKKAYTVKGLYLTNAQITYNSISNGDDYGAKKFEANDWFKVTIYNMNKTSKVEFYLADFRNNKKEIINEWKWVDLTSLGETTGLKFELSSTDNNDYGMLTPAYFCMDGITLEEK